MMELAESGEYIGKEGNIFYEDHIQSFETTTPRWMNFFQILVQLIRSDRTKSASRLCEHFVFNQAQTIKDRFCDLLAMGTDQVAAAIQHTQAPDPTIAKEDADRPFPPEAINNIE